MSATIKPPRRVTIEWEHLKDETGGEPKQKIYEGDKKEGDTVWHGLPGNEIDPKEIMGWTVVDYSWTPNRRLILTLQDPYVT